MFSFGRGVGGERGLGLRKLFFYNGSKFKLISFFFMGGGGGGGGGARVSDFFYYESKSKKEKKNWGEMGWGLGGWGARVIFY